MFEGNVQNIKTHIFAENSEAVGIVFFEFLSNFNKINSIFNIKNIKMGPLGAELFRFEVCMFSDFISQ